jgi:hypothetical protein
MSSDMDEPYYRKLIPLKSLEIPVPGKQAIIGFFVFLGICLGLHLFVLWLCSRLARG